MLASLLCGAALAAYEVNELRRAMTVSHQIAQAIASGLGGGTVSRTSSTVSVSLCFGLIPLGPVDKPYLVVAVGDVILGTLVAGLVILMVYSLRGGFRRNAHVGRSDKELRNA
jgi:hypothetical protein